MGRPLLSFIGPFTDILAQKDFFRLPPPGWSLEVRASFSVVFSRPAFVSPPVRDLYLPIFRLTDFVLLFVALPFSLPPQETQPRPGL